MPTDTALALIAAYRAKRKSNPDLDRATLYKYVLWDRFQGAMILDREIDEMAGAAESVYELAVMVALHERPQLAEPGLRATLEKELARFFDLNAPDLL